MINEKKNYLMNKGIILYLFVSHVIVYSRIVKLSVMLSELETVIFCRLWVQLLAVVVRV